jgi:hypothetical protein
LLNFHTFFFVFAQFSPVFFCFFPSFFLFFTCSVPAMKFSVPAALLFGLGSALARHHPEQSIERPSTGQWSLSAAPVSATFGSPLVFRVYLALDDKRRDALKEALYAAADPRAPTYGAYRCV